MYRSLLALFVAAPLFAFPAPKDRDPGFIYYPTKAGTKRVYETLRNQQEEEITYTITNVEVTGGVYRVTESLEGGPTPIQGRELTTEVSEKGIFRPPTGKRKEALPLLKLPAKEGGAWTAEFPLPFGDGLVKNTYRVGKEEEVEVPAGYFKTILVEVDGDVGGNAQTTRIWYAPGVGIVKSTMKSGKSEQTRVLKSFTEGK